MNSYSFEKGMVIIAEYVFIGIALILPLLFDGGIIRQVMYFVLITFTCKGIYDLYKESTLRMHFLICLYMALAGVVTGFSVGYIALIMYMGLLFEFQHSILRLILISLPALGGGTFLAYRLDAYKQKLK